MNILFIYMIWFLIFFNGIIGLIIFINNPLPGLGLIGISFICGFEMLFDKRKELEGKE